VLVDEPAGVSAALARMAAAVLPIFRVIVLAAAAGSAAGEASADGQPLKDKQGRTADFAFALYARDAH